MIKGFRYIATEGGKQTVNQFTNDSTIIQDCFRYCPDDIRRQVDAFLEDDGAKHIDFEFGELRVRVVREMPPTVREVAARVENGEIDFKEAGRLLRTSYDNARNWVKKEIDR